MIRFRRCFTGWLDESVSMSCGEGGGGLEVAGVVGVHDAEAGSHGGVEGLHHAVGDRDREGEELRVGEREAGSDGVGRSVLILHHETEKTPFWASRSKTGILASVSDFFEYLFKFFLRVDLTVFPQVTPVAAA